MGASLLATLQSAASCLLQEFRPCRSELARDSLVGSKLPPTRIQALWERACSRLFGRQRAASYKNSGLVGASLLATLWSAASCLLQEFRHCGSELARDSLVGSKLPPAGQGSSSAHRPSSRQRPLRLSVARAVQRPRTCVGARLHALSPPHRRALRAPVRRALA